jgi:uncharacterized protein YdeI (BOF family)
MENNKSIQPHITKLSYVRVEGTYDCIQVRLNTRGQSSARGSSGVFQENTTITQSKRRHDGECITKRGLIFKYSRTHDDMYGAPGNEPRHLQFLK